MEAKERVGREAAKYVENGMTIGIGTGTTAAFFIDEVAKRMKKENLDLTFVSTSDQSTALARSLGMIVLDIDEVDSIDLTIDGVDEFTADKNGIKGGGGALLIEKIVATYSKRVLWIAEESKLVDNLGAFPLPVEVIKDGSAHLYQAFEDLGYEPTFRSNEYGGRFLTDSNNYIIDLHLHKIDAPYALSDQLRQMVGVVEQGLFLDIADDVLVGNDQGTYLLSDRFPS